jgi:hypothetical protein
VPYPQVPATLLDRLAVDWRNQGKGHGRFLLANDLHRSAQSEIASFPVVVDALDDNARHFCAPIFSLVSRSAHETTQIYGRYSLAV